LLRLWCLLRLRGGLVRLLRLLRSALTGNGGTALRRTLLPARLLLGDPLAERHALPERTHAYGTPLRRVGVTGRPG
ncbi:hypothetical protein G3I23_15920, partial [Streptomyces sp. SID10115]|nr:hypothetical protein [Streptomyces sp. SID10115]